jgi:hypothetical protein
MQIFGDVMAKKGEKRGNRECFIAVAKHFEVDAMLVILIGEP